MFSTLALFAGCNPRDFSGELTVDHAVTVSSCQESARGQCLAFEVVTLRPLSYATQARITQLIDRRGVFKNELRLVLTNPELGAPAIIIVPVNDSLALPWEGGELTLSGRDLQQNFDLAIRVTKTIRDEIRDIRTPCMHEDLVAEARVLYHLEVREIRMTLQHSKTGEALGHFKTELKDYQANGITLWTNGVQCVWP
ncbi:MAG: hypothetical protein NDJ90_07355 [Oligoflexia bacterium]|nr:hypothetical protein [Oligoflexia bacterium]